ncbi:hypothetical protein N7478_010852 [Penicillium angulare]|uniref:uncharacterized protein n=1 Tax=Penicillium angulare TaxID=116970 RepID=UPI00254048E5|nr:uncharacterized protein N7478_010852 [Penicillium angulare]KAJ5263247.1 hypothetical protein N7478_010852 [Penicillium angulare]
MAGTAMHDVGQGGSAWIPPRTQTGQSDSDRRRTTATGPAEPRFFSTAMGAARGESALQPNRQAELQ